MTSAARFVIIGVAALVAAPSEALADAPGAIAGLVTDVATGAPLPGVTVVATSPLTPAHAAVTDESGHYALPALPPGEYMLTLYYLDLVVERTGVRVAPFDETLASQAIDLVAAPRRTGVVIAPSLPAVLDRRGGIGTIVGLTTRGVVVSGLRMLFQVQTFDHPQGDYFRRDFIRLTPQLLYSRDGAPRANDFGFGLAAEYFADLSLRLKLAGGIGGGVDLAQRAAQGWYEARLTPTIRILRSTGESDGHHFYGPYGHDVDLAVQLRLVHDLGDGRTSGIAELGVDLLW